MTNTNLISWTGSAKVLGKNCTVMFTKDGVLSISAEIGPDYITDPCKLTADDARDIMASIPAAALTKPDKAPSNGKTEPAKKGLEAIEAQVKSLLVKRDNDICSECSFPRNHENHSPEMGGVPGHKFVDPKPKTINDVLESQASTGAPSMSRPPKESPPAQEEHPATEEEVDAGSAQKVGDPADGPAPESDNESAAPAEAEREPGEDDPLVEELVEAISFATVLEILIKHGFKGETTLTEACQAYADRVPLIQKSAVDPAKLLARVKRTLAILEQ